MNCNERQIAVVGRTNTKETVLFERTKEIYVSCGMLDLLTAIYIAARQYIRE